MEAEGAWTISDFILEEDEMLRLAGLTSETSSAPWMGFQRQQGPLWPQMLGSTSLPRCEGVGP